MLHCNPRHPAAPSPPCRHLATATACHSAHSPCAAGTSLASDRHHGRSLLCRCSGRPGRETCRMPTQRRPINRQAHPAAAARADKRQRGGGQPLRYRWGPFLPRTALVLACARMRQLPPPSLQQRINPTACRPRQQRAACCCPRAPPPPPHSYILHRRAGCGSRRLGRRAGGADAGAGQKMASCAGCWRGVASPALSCPCWRQRRVLIATACPRCGCCRGAAVATPGGAPGGVASTPKAAASLACRPAAPA